MPNATGAISAGTGIDTTAVTSLGKPSGVRVLTLVAFLNVFVLMGGKSLEQYTNSVK